MTRLGEPLLRLEDRPLVTGTGSYVADLIDASTLHCAFVRSTLAHGTFDPPSVEEALAMPGVVAVELAGTLDLPDLPSSPGRGAPDAEGMGQSPLARGRVRHVGDPIAVVVAETPQQALDAAEAIWVDLEPLPAVMDVETALAGETLLFPATGSNLVDEVTVGSSGPRPETQVETTVHIDIPRVSPVTIEPLAILVRPVDGRLEVWCGHQSPARLPHQLGSMLGLDPSTFRARVPDVGGAFGTKGQFYAEYPVVAALAHRLGRPVAWIQGRREQLLSGTHGRGQEATVRIGGDRDGRIRFVQARFVGDIGAYPVTGSRIPFFSQSVSQGAYDIEHLEVTALAVVTTKAPTGPYRGAGRPEGAIAIERAVDAFAAAIGMAPEEVRRINFVRPDAFPYRSQVGTVYDSGDYAATMQVALEAVEIDRWRSEQESRRADGRDPIGIGIGTFIERAGGAPGSAEYGRVEVRDDGAVVVRTGSTAAGQGHRTVWSQIASSVLDVPPDQIVFYAGDTDEVADGVGSFGSRSAQLGGSAVFRSANQVRERILEVAAKMLEASEADLELVGGQVRVAGSPGSEVSFAEVSADARSRGVDLAAEDMFSADAQTFPYGAYVAVVEVEVETGQVNLLQLVAVDDCGTILNPMVVEGQVHGSIMQGIGEAFLEGIHYDGDGQPMTANLMSYLIPNAIQPFPLISKRTVHPAPSNPLGAKGSGESGCIGAPPAILNAVHDALRDRGVSSLGFPLTPARVWGAIHRPSGGATT